MPDDVKAQPTKLEVLTASMVERAQNIQLLLKLIEKATSIAVVRDYLKAKGLQHSASSWDDLRTKRIVPAVDDGRLSFDDLYSLLRRTEGFGRQHIFLYHCDPARAAIMVGERRVRSLLKQMGIEGVRESPLVVDLPDSPELVDVVFSDSDQHSAVTFKEVETRTTRKPREEQVDKAAKTVTKVWDIEEHRAINVARIWANGTLEVRIASRDNTTRYHDDLANFFKRLSPLVKRAEFKEVSLRHVKHNLWAKKSELKDSVRFSTYTLENDDGLSLRANASLSTDDLADSEVLDKSLAQFMADKTTHCSGSNIYLKRPTDDESKWTHVLLNGEDNEFAITAAITAEEYDYVLQQIRTYN